MDFVSAVKSCLRQSASFSGKASRSEFWWFHLFMALVMIVLIILANIVMMISQMMTSRVDDMIPSIALLSLFLLYVIAYLALSLSSLAVSVRRLHDVGLSGWWLLLYLTGIGALLLLYWWALPSKE